MSLLAPNLENFLVRAGIPHIAAPYMIESAKAVKGSVWDMMQSVFISFGGPDEAFARKLYEALHSNGVRTFFFPEHAEPGKPLHRLMRDAVKEHDRVVLVCSKNSNTAEKSHMGDGPTIPSTMRNPAIAGPSTDSRQILGDDLDVVFCAIRDPIARRQIDRQRVMLNHRSSWPSPATHVKGKCGFLYFGSFTW